MHNNEDIKKLKSQNPEFCKAFDSLHNEHTMTLRKISHELGNALTLINSSLQIIESSHPEVKTFKYWDTTMEDIIYMKNLISQISQFNNGETLSLSIVQLHSILNDVVNSFLVHEDVINKKISITLNANSDIPDISGDYIKLKQVFINIIKNAIEACDENDSIIINLEVKTSSINICISDTGCGLNETQLKNIFNPMVTYKPGGTGLGLPISRRIIKAHKGNISASSVVNKGTTFLIEFPL
ncbi:MAG: HAMP domain-containing histidine kinase [Lachnospiraceae bacterium]|nr:HAMP domain-containing histidine kinase [Lachnospiraceae bacterium]